jgi:sterol desaturase/sphingolipid hydroxylase (fatty acid hydroxylase superfamily)
MTIYIIFIGIAFIILERLIPDQKLPVVKGWWMRVVILNLFQIGVLYLGKTTWDNWFVGASIFHLSNYFSEPIAGFIGYFVITFVYYWWHRWRHTINFLWLTMHQVHHSPQRIETITSFYKHPVEIICNSIIIGSVNFLILGLSLESAAWSLLFASMGEYFYHMNIKTPHWIGYIFQRPEMHRIHHERNKHFNNFSDFPIWDMLFGTFKNPKLIKVECGFKPEREEKLFDMLLFKNVNNPFQKEEKK